MAKIVFWLVSGAATLYLGAAWLNSGALSVKSFYPYSPNATFYAIEDATANQNAPDSNYGNSSSLAVRKDEFLQEAYSYLRFDLSSIPVGSVVTSATLNLRLTLANTDPGDPRISIYWVVGDWTENTLTWNHKPSTVLTGNYLDVTPTLVWKTWTITEMVQCWVNHDVLCDDASLAVRANYNKMFLRDFSSSEGFYRPYLSISYNPPTSTPTATATNTSPPTKTHTPTHTFTPSRTSSPTNTFTGTQPTPSHTWTHTHTSTSTLTPSFTHTFTATPKPTLTSSSTATAQPGALGDRVWHDIDRDGRQDADEAGLAAVTLYLIQDGFQLATDVSDAQGNYLFPDLASGWYTVQVDIRSVPPGYTVTTGFAQEYVQVVAGQSNLTVDYGYAAGFTPTPMPEVTADLYFDSFDVVQVVPDAPLVEDKATVVRVYVGARNTNDAVQNVTGRLIRVGVDSWNDGLRSENTISVAPDVDPRSTNRENINGTLNFRLPAEWRTGEYWINVWINYIHSASECDPCSDNNIGSRVLHFYAADPLNVVMVRVRAEGHTPPRSARVETVRWLKKVYPINHVNIYVSGEDPLDSDYDYTTDEAWEDLLNDLWWLNFWTDDPVDNLKYYGMLDDEVTTDQIGGMGYRPGDESAGVVTPGELKGQRTMAHEVAHNLNRRHAPCATNPPANVDPNYPNADGTLDGYGLDAETMALYPAATNYDLMSYCNPRWLSSYTYWPLFDQFGIAPADRIPPMDTRQAFAPAADGLYLLVNGRLKDGKVSKLEPFYRLSLPQGSNDGPGSGSYTIELRNATGGLIFRRAFDPIANPDLLNHGVFHEVLPYMSGISRIVILSGTVELASRAVSPHAPTVTLLSPNGGESWASDSMQVVSWSSSDLDGDSLVYTLQYSADNGLTWRALAANLTTQSHQVDASVLSGSSQALIRVIASDGVNTAVDTSNAVFSVGYKAPEVFILTPVNGSSISPGKMQELDGITTDVEDGPLPDSALVWSSDRMGVLGVGEHLATSTLLPGWHILTLTAVDSDLQTGSASVRVYVGHLTLLPAVRR